MPVRSDNPIGPNPGSEVFDTFTTVGKPTSQFTEADWALVDELVARELGPLPKPVSKDEPVSVGKPHPDLRRKEWFYERAMIIQRVRNADFVTSSDLLGTARQVRCRACGKAGMIEARTKRCFDGCTPAESESGDAEGS